MLISLIFPFWQALQLHALPMALFSHWKIIKIRKARQFFVFFFLISGKEIKERGKNHSELLLMIESLYHVIRT